MLLGCPASQDGATRGSEQQQGLPGLPQHPLGLARLPVPVILPSGSQLQQRQNDCQEQTQGKLGLSLRGLAWNLPQ